MIRAALPLPGFPRKILILLGGLALAGVSSGCRTYQYRPEPLTTAQVIALSAEKRPVEEIIQRIRESRTVYLLHARDVKDLLDKGVDERVVDEMLETRLRDERAWRRYYYGYPYYYYGPSIGFGYRFYP
jgi:hypothetical protein